jgi:hypothetical protein
MLMGGVLLSACLERPVAVEGQLGREIPLADADALGLPRVAFEIGACEGEPGGCPAYCEDRPEDCLEADADTCMPMLIASGSPFTILPSDSGQFAVERRCFEIRPAAGLGAGATQEALDDAVSRLRFLDPAVVRAPGDEVAGWTWDVGSDRASRRIGGVLGGSTLRSFAVALRNKIGDPPSVTFFRNFPGEERALADQGRAYLRLQFPSRLLGRQVDDKCDVGGVDCELAGLDLRPDDEELVYESTRMLLDACIAPPACVPLFESDPIDPAADPKCRLRPGGVFENPACVDATDADGGGVSGSLLVGTGMPDLVLFDDSATRMFGNLGQLPDCSALPADTQQAMQVRACTESMDGFLFAPGWPALPGLRRLRVRALGLLPGNGAVAGPSPCVRLQRRIKGLQQQCKDFSQRQRPWQPVLDSDERIDYAAALLGEAHWVGDQVGPDSARWLPALIVPSTAPMAISLRRDVGSDALEPDGIVGSTLLEDTEVVLDYTEADASPGVRLTCLHPGSGDCVSITACHPVSESTEVDESSPPGRTGRIGCCYGLPQALIGRVIREAAEKDPPRIEEACCGALQPEALAQLQQEDVGLCAGVDPL